MPKGQLSEVEDRRAHAELDTARARIAKKLEKLSELFEKENSPPDDDNSGATGP